MDPVVGRFLLYVPLFGIGIVVATVVTRALALCVEYALDKWVYPMKQSKGDLHESFKAKRGD